MNAVSEKGEYFIELRMAELRVSDFATAKSHGELHAMPFLEKRERRRDLHSAIVFGSARPQANLLHGGPLRDVASRLGHALRFVLPSSEVEQLAGGRIASGIDLDEIESGGFGAGTGFGQGHDSDHLAALTDESHAWRSDAAIHPDQWGFREFIGTDVSFFSLLGESQRDHSLGRARPFVKVAP